ncbi:MAG: MBL fold metallo-hydrolase, partial [Dehalococcoidales bacterium]|nr:MBL fold metallo-hydrolase [Dehalococcoidales bacterium]
SHRHLDHSTDLNVMVEAMTNGGFNRRGRVFAPGDCFGPEPVLFSYLKEFIDGITVLEEGQSYDIGPVSFSTPVRHVHTVETYGMTFRTPRHTFSCVTDTRYFDGLSHYAGSDLLIINMVFTKPIPTVDHLSLPDVERILTELKPKAAILNHYGLHVWQAKPPLLAEELAQSTGIRVIAARDGMKFDLAVLDDKSAFEERADGQP